MVRKEHHGDWAGKKDRNLEDPLVTGHRAALWSSFLGGSELVSQEQGPAVGSKEMTCLCRWMNLEMVMVSYQLVGI